MQFYVGLFCVCVCVYLYAFMLFVALVTFSQFVYTYNSVYLSEQVQMAFICTLFVHHSLSVEHKYYWCRAVAYPICWSVCQSVCPESVLWQNS